MSKFKVLHYYIGNHYSGGAEYIMNNWRFINKDKFQFDFISYEPVEIYRDIIKDDKQIKIITKMQESKDGFIRDIRRVFSQGYDAVHLHTSYWKGFLLEELAKEYNIPKIIVHSHSTHIDCTDDEKRKRIEEVHNKLKQEFNTSLATDFWACSKKAADWLYGEKIPKERIKIMNNAIEVDRFLYNTDIREIYRKEFGIDDCFVIGNVGRFDYQKNHEFLIDIFEEVSRRNDKARLLLIGNGSLEETIKDRVEKLGIKDKVIFTGARRDVNCILQAMDVFCLPSRFEGLPIVLVEAQAAGLKCVVSDTVTDEICITDNIELLPLNKEQWVEELLNLKKGYDRRNMYEEITAAGYNIKEQIKVVEKLYMG